MLLDHFVTTVVIMIVAAPGVLYDVSNMIGNPDAPIKLFLGNYYLNILACSLIFNKDIYLGRSVAKRVLKFQIVDNNSNMPSNPLRCFVRNLTIIIWPIEVLFTLVNKQRRLGDYIAGTKLVTYNSDIHSADFNWGLAVVAFVVSILFTYAVLFYPVEVMMEGVF